VGAARDRWLLPEGVEEVLPPEAAHIERMRRRVLDLFASWGYELCIPPLIEYLESLLTGTGPDLDLQTFKLIDQVSGRLMGVRADMTPQVARIDAHQLGREEPVRLCYIGTVLHTRPDGLSGTRTPIQVGAELYGHGAIESDCEIVSLMLETLAIAGVEDVHVGIGHMGIFRALARRAALEPATEAELFAALQRKAHAEIGAILREAGVAAREARALEALADLNGGDAVLDEAERLLGEAPEARGALGRLRALGRFVRGHARARLHFDLAELRGYRYERGVVFAAFVPGHGGEVARGGRYDGLGEAFGRSREAIGFSTDLRTLVELGALPAEPASGIFSPWPDDGQLAARVRELRRRGERVLCELPGQGGDAARMGCDRRLVQEDGTWVVRPVAEHGP